MSRTAGFTACFRVRRVDQLLAAARAAAKPATRDGSVFRLPGSRPDECPGFHHHQTSLIVLIANRGRSAVFHAVYAVHRLSDQHRRATLNPGRRSSSSHLN